MNLIIIIGPVICRLGFTSSTMIEKKWRIEKKVLGWGRKPRMSFNKIWGLLAQEVSHFKTAGIGIGCGRDRYHGLIYVELFC